MIEGGGEELGHFGVRHHDGFLLLGGSHLNSRHGYHQRDAVLRCMVLGRTTQFFIEKRTLEMRQNHLGNLSVGLASRDLLNLLPTKMKFNLIDQKGNGTSGLADSIDV